MRQLLFALTTLLTPLVAHADTQDAVEEPFSAVVKGDFTGDGRIDTAVIVEDLTGEGLLHLTLSQGQSHKLENFVWIGGIGQEPWLELTEHGSLLVASQNSAIGRNRWEQVITLAHRNDALRVAGYTFRWYDTLNLDDNGICDLNLLSGKGEITLGQGDTSKTIRLTTKSRPVTEWPSDMPKECAALLN